MKKLQKILALNLLSSALFACGGSDSNNESSSNITSQNKEMFADAATLGAQKAIQSSTNDLALLSANVTNDDQDSSGVASFNAILASSVCSLGGDAEITGQILDTNQELFESGNINIDLNRCIYDDGSMLDGMIGMTWTGATSENQRLPSNVNMTFDLTSIDVFSDGSELSQSINGETSCSQNFDVCETTINNISYNADGNTIEASDFSSTYDDNGYDIDAMAKYNNSSINVSGNDLIPCADGSLESGTIDVSENSGLPIMTIEILNCSSYSLTYNGETNIYEQI